MQLLSKSCLFYLPLIDFLELFKNRLQNIFSHPQLVLFLSKNPESRLTFFSIYTQTTKYQGRRIVLGDTPKLTFLIGEKSNLINFDPWVKFYNFQPNNDSEKWSRKIFLELLHAEAIFFLFIFQTGGWQIQIDQIIFKIFVKSRC